MVYGITDVLGRSAESLGVYRASFETPCGLDKERVWTCISGTNERRSQQMLAAKTDEVQTSGFTSENIWEKKNRGNMIENVTFF